MRATRALLAPALLHLFLLASASAQLLPMGVQHMQLLTPEIGWASTPNQLFWTSDAGRNWKNVTPSTSPTGKVAAVFFLDASRGWVLSSGWEQSTGAPRFELAFTNNAGTSWLITPVKIRDLSPPAPNLGGGGHIDFVDPMHGWMNLDVVSSSNFSAGILLATDDGGSSWHRAPKSPGVSGSIRFVSNSEGWLSGGPNEQLFVTRDGSNTWQEVSLPAPAQLHPTRSTYELPTFTDSKNGFLPVRYSAEALASSVVLFATHDAGTTWAPQTALPATQHERERLAVTDSSLIVASLSGGTQLTVTRSTSAGTSSKSAHVDLPGFGVVKLSFSDINHGWALAFRGTWGKLLSTADGGATWTDITPRSGAGPSPAVPQRGGRRTQSQFPALLERY